VLIVPSRSKALGFRTIDGGSRRGSKRSGLKGSDSGTKKRRKKSRRDRERLDRTSKPEECLPA